jgi:predicted nucleic acid-binding protein
MEWVKKLSGSIVGLDTAPLIYLIEKNPKYLPIVSPFFQALERGEFQVVTSTITLCEVLVHPYRHGDLALAQQYSRILHRAPNLTMLPVSSPIAEEAARIRSTHGMRTPDAIQLATALAGQAASFLTNDTGLHPIPGMQILVLENLLANSLP